MHPNSLLVCKFVHPSYRPTFAKLFIMILFLFISHFYLVNSNSQARGIKFIEAGVCMRGYSRIFIVFCFLKGDSVHLQFKCSQTGIVSVVDGDGFNGTGGGGFLLVKGTYGQTSLTHPNFICPSLLLLVGYIFCTDMLKVRKPLCYV